MKKLIFGICAAAAIFMVGCSKDASTDEVPASNAINFSTYLGRDVQKRSSILDNTSLTNFGVFASYTMESNWTSGAACPGFNFMYNQLVEKVSGVWDYSPKKYWPTTKGEKISFWAYAPYATSGSGISVVSDASYSDTPIIRYTVNVESGKDFVAATLMNQVRTAPATGSAPVTYTDPDGSTRTVEFALKHELTRVNIQAKLDKTVDPATKVNITSISLNGNPLLLEGYYSFPKTTGDRGTWAISDNPNFINVDPLMNKVNTSIGGYTTAGIRLSNTAAVPVFKTGEYLFLIPPGGVTGTSAAGDFICEVCYDIVTEDPALAAGHSVSTAVKFINLPAGTLQQGKAYLYTLTFYTNEIVLSASVEDWGTEVGVGDDVDWNDNY